MLLPNRRVSAGPAKRLHNVAAFEIAGPSCTIAPELTCHLLGSGCRSSPETALTRWKRGLTMSQYITLQEAARLLPNKPSACTLWRWCVRGIHVRESDEVVRLRFVCIGRKYFTAAEWLDEFIDNVTAARIAGHRQKYGDKPDARWNRIRELAQADEVLRRARI